MFMSMRKGSHTKGQSVLEVLVALGIFAISMIAGFQLFFGGQTLSVDSTNAELAGDYAQEGLEAVRNIRARNWSELADGSHGLVFQNNEWMFGSSSASDAKDIFTRTVSIVTISDNIKIATTTITWQTDPLRPQKLELVEQMTNWQNPSVSGCNNGSLSGNWANPQVLGTGDLGPGNEGTDVVVKLPYAYVSGVASSASKPDIFVFDVSNPSAPSLVASRNIGDGGINALFLKGNYLYAASAHNQKEFIVFDVTNPTAITELASLDLAAAEDGIAIYGMADTIYLGRKETGQKELVVIDVSNPAAPSIATSFVINDDVNDIFVTNQKLYLVSEESNKDIWIYDVSAPNSPVFLANYNLTGGEAISAALRLPGDLMVGDDSNKIFMLGATTTDLYVRSSVLVGGAVNDVACVSDNFAFLSTSNSGKEFMIINISNPDSVSEYASLNFPQVGTGIDFAENKVFMSVRSNDALRIITSQ